MSFKDFYDNEFILEEDELNEAGEPKELHLGESRFKDFYFTEEKDEDKEGEDEDDEDTGPGGHVRDGSGPHGRGLGPGKGKRVCDDKEEEDEDEIEEEERTRIDRKKTRGKKEALNTITKGQFANWDLRKKAQFIAKYEYKEISPGKGRYVIRKQPKNAGDVYKQLKKKSKSFKKMQKTKGAAIQKKIQRIKNRGEP